MALTPRARHWLALPFLAWSAMSCGHGKTSTPGGSDYLPDVFVPAVVLPALHVDGNHIVDGSGATVVLKGIALADPDQVDQDGHWDEEYFRQAAAWGAKVVRIPVHPKHWRALGPGGYLALLDRGVAWAEALGMYVILDWHGMGDPVADVYEPGADGLFVTSQAETRSFWRIAAAHYRNDPGVAFFEIFNEATNWMSNGIATSTTWSQWRAMAETLIDIARAQGATAICIVGGFHWSFDLSPVGADPVAREGVAYSIHPYPSQAGATAVTAWQADFGYLTATYPVFATEFGFDGDPSDEVAYATADGYGTAITEFFAARGMSWTVWVFHPVWTPSLISDWSYTPTAPQGTFFQAVLESG
jgi:hypothetical protein